MKRFWTEVSIDADRVVRLDDKPVRTPGRRLLALPGDALAEAVADEWRAVEGEITPRTMKLTGLANAALDRIGPERSDFAASLARFGESDLLCYRADGPADLVLAQAAAWNPPLAWARARYDVAFVVTTGILHRAQPGATIARLGEAVAARGAFELAALAPVVTIGGSLVLALAWIEQALSAGAVWDAAELDEEWQAARWGRDPLSLAARDARRGEFEAAERFRTLLAVAKTGEAASPVRG